MTKRQAQQGNSGWFDSVLSEGFDDDRPPYIPAHEGVAGLRMADWLETTDEVNEGGDWQ